MKLFPQKVTANLSALAIAALQPIFKKLGLLSATPPQLPAATVPEDEWTDSEEESYNQAAVSYKARGSTTLPLKEPTKDVKQPLLRVSLSSVVVEPCNSSVPLYNFHVKEGNITLFVANGDDGHVQPTKDDIVSPYNQW